MGINNSFGNYSPPEEQDDGIQEFFIGLFFDGTLNNEKNVYARKSIRRKRKVWLMIKTLRMNFL